MTAPRAIVTGSESGIGRATAIALARAGYDVGVTWFRSEADGRAVAQLVEAEGRRAALRFLDVTRVADARATIDALADALSGLDAFVNCAGVLATHDALEIDEDDFRRVLDADLVGPFFAAQAAARRMVRDGVAGRIVNVTSVHEHVPLARAAAYTAAKHGLGGVTKALALELAAHGITVNSVAPGAVATPMSDQADPDAPPRERAVPLGREALADEIAALVVHLVRDAAYTTGASYVADGGMLLRTAPSPPTRPG